MRQAVYISLSQALSWLAFGVRRDAKELNAELSGAAFGMDRQEALDRLESVLEALVTSAHAGLVELQGKCNTSPAASTAGKTAVIPAIAMADCRAFDIITDGLRRGHGLLWLSLTGYVTPALTGEHYSDVLVKATDLQKHHKQMFQAPRAPTVPQASLKKWFGKLSTTDRKLPIKILWDLAKKSFPNNAVPRAKIEALTPSRPRGRPKNKP